MDQFGDVRELLEAELRHPPNSRLWKNLTHAHREKVVAARSGREGLDALCGWYQVLAAIHGVKAPGSESPNETKTVGPDKRLYALTRIAVLEAGRDAMVRRFRERYLPGGPVKLSGVDTWLRERERDQGTVSPAHVRLSVDLGEQWSLDPERARARWASYWDETSRATPSRAYRQAIACLPVCWERESFADWLEQQAAEVRAGNADPPSSFWRTPTLPLGDSDTGRVVVGESGALRDLWEVASGLTSWIPWTLRSAVQFILTGRPREILKAAVDADVSTVPALSRVRLTVDPRTSAQHVAGLYERARTAFARGRDTPMDDKHLALAVFCAEHEDRHLKWRDLRDLWNASHPEWVYEGTNDDEMARPFGRDARAAYKRVTGRTWQAAKTLDDEGGRIGELLEQDGPLGRRSVGHSRDWYLPWADQAEEGGRDERSS